MDWLNYHHLYYFWVTAREGSLTGAAEKLRLAPSTVSAQIRTLEEALGQPLFERRGRGLELTDAGRLAAGYGDEIFALGHELRGVLREGNGNGRPIRLRVGVANIVPKLVAYRLLSPVLHMDQPVQLVCHEDTAERLVADLALHQLDLVIADAPVGLARDLKAFSREIGECGITVMGVPALVERYGERFPDSLHDAPFLMPGTGTTMRSLLDVWFEGRGIHPRIVGEFADSALLKAFGQEGAGMFPVPTLIAAEVSRQYGVERLGGLPEVREHFFAITMSERSANPAIRRLMEEAHAMLEHGGPPSPALPPSTD